MDSSTPPPPPPPLTAVTNDPVASMVDPFLVEALQNPRHRLTILRMELDIQKFLHSDQQQFEFQHFPTSYLRLAAHRVAQHFGLVTLVHDTLEGQGTRIVVRKVAETIYPAIHLSDIPVKQSENEKHEQKKIVIRARPSKASSNGTSELGKRSSIRTVEERKEEYDRARARIFSGSSSPESEDAVSQAPVDENNVCFAGGENLNVTGRAILRDREKDRTDPDYDRSYDRYVRILPSCQNINLVPFNVQKFQPPYLQYDSVIPQLGQMPSPQASLGYRSPMMSPYCAVRVNQTSRGAAYMQWPSHSIMYTQPYDQFRHAVFQSPFCQQQQPLSFDYSQHH